MQKRNLLLSIASGVILALAMPWPGWWVLSWVGLIPLFIALRDAKMPQAIGYGFLTGVVYYGIVIYWMTLFGYLPWALLGVMEALFLAVFAGAAVRLMPSRVGWSGYLLVPAAWSGMQWLRSLGVYSFTWGSLAHIHANAESLIQLSAVTGPWGVDFLICLLNLALAQALWPAARIKRFGPAVAAAALMAAAWGAGTLAMRADYQPNVKAAVVQGCAFEDTMPDSRYLSNALNIYRQLTLKAAKDGAEIVVWPETVLPVNIDSSYLEREVSNTARQAGTTLICGAYTTADNPKAPGASNGAHFFDANGRKIGVYKKVRLVPFGEFVPLRDRLPFLKNYGIRPEDVVPGTERVVMDTEQGKGGVSICFESLFPQISRWETRHGAQMLFVITNDGWFGRTQAPRQHLMMSKLRAVENRRYVMRAASTGISAVIDPYGRTVAELGLQKRGIVEARVGAISALTPYARFGDWFAYACVVAAAAGLLLTRSKKQLPDE